MHKYLTKSIHINISLQRQFNEYYYFLCLQYYCDIDN